MIHTVSNNNSKEEFKLLKAEKKDLAEILAVQKLAFYEIGRFYRNFRIMPLLTTLSELEDSFQKYLYLKVCRMNQIVGSLRAFVSEDICQIENVIVHPSFQNKGIGKYLMKEVEQFFPACHSFGLITGKLAVKNVNFYCKLGYSIVDEIAASENEPDFVVMRKTCRSQIT